MNKKLLGIAAVALLGVSAAFAATTSTVYFTASGTLTKVAEALGKETDDTGSGNTHTSDSKIGISYVYTKFSDSDSNVSDMQDYLRPTAVSKGNKISDDTTAPLSVEYSRNGKVANPSTTNTTYDLSNPPYIYHEVYLKGLSFSKEGDYYIIPFDLCSFEDDSYSIACKQYDLTTTLTKTNKLKNLNNNLSTTKATIRETESKEITLDADANYKASYLFMTSSKKNDSSSLSNPTDSTITLTKNNPQLLYLYITVSTDYTGSKTSFSGVSIPLPEFTKVSNE